MSATLLRDRDGLLAARRPMTVGGGHAQAAGHLLSHFAESYAGDAR